MAKPQLEINFLCLQEAADLPLQIIFYLQELFSNQTEEEKGDEWHDKVVHLISLDLHIRVSCNAQEAHDVLVALCPYRDHS